MPFEDLRSYLKALEKDGLFHWVDKEVDKDWEIASIARMIFRGFSEDKRFGLGFRNIKGFPGGQVVTGVIAASTRQIATALETEPVPFAIFERITDGINNPVDPILVETGPCKEVITNEADLNLLSFPIPIWTPRKDAGPYLTPLWVTKDPETGERNIGMRRCQVKGRNKTGILFGAPDRYGAIHHTKWKERREPMPAALFMGADPVTYLVGPSRFGIDELAVAGGIMGKPVEMVRCETSDLEVPANVEMVVEGEISTEYLEAEGPFGEFTGHMAGGRECPVFTAKCITHRRDPILLGLISQFPPSESTMIKRNLLEASLYKHLSVDLKIPGIVDIHAIEAGGCTAILWASVKKMYQGQVEQLVCGVMGYFGMSYYKWIVVTDDDVDIRDPFIRDWVLSWRVRPEEDIRILSTSAAVELDPSSMPPDEMQVMETWSQYELPPLGNVQLPQGL
jgi:UbiD family decarboxylase